MAADLAAPVRDVDTSTPFELDCRALDDRRLNDDIELLERMLSRDDGRPEWTTKKQKIYKKFLKYFYIKGFLIGKKPIEPGV